VTRGTTFANSKTLCLSLSSLISRVLVPQRSTHLTHQDDHHKRQRLHRICVPSSPLSSSAVSSNIRIKIKSDCQQVPCIWSRQELP